MPMENLHVWKRSTRQGDHIYRCNVWAYDNLMLVKARTSMTTRLLTWFQVGLWQTPQHPGSGLDGIHQNCKITTDVQKTMEETSMKHNTLANFVPKPFNHHLWFESWRPFLKGAPEQLWWACPIAWPWWAWAPGHDHWEAVSVLVHGEELTQT